MTVAKLISSSLSNLGYGGATRENPFVDTAGLVATTTAFNLTSLALAATEATWTTGVKAKTVFPFPKIWDVEDVSEEIKMATSTSGKNVKRTGNRIIKKRFTFDATMDVNKALKSFDNAAIRVFLFDSSNNIKFYLNGSVPTGFSVSSIIFEGQKDAMQDGSKPSLASVLITFKDSEEWDQYGHYVCPTWRIADVEPLTDVYLEQVGTWAATGGILRAYSYSNYTTAGAINKIPITGLVKADFSALTTAGASQTSAITGSVVDNADGTYTFTCTGFANGSIDLVSPATLSNGYFDGVAGTITVT